VAPSQAWLAVAAAILLSSPADAAPRTWEKTFTVSGRPTLRVHTRDAAVRLRRGAEGAIAARVVHDAHRWGFTLPPRDPIVTLEQAGNEVTVSVREPATMVVFGGISERFDVDVTIPGECDVVVQSSDGPVTVEPGVKGRIDLESQDGRLTVKGASGDVQLTTQDGTIEASELEGVVRAESEDGRVHLEGRFDRLEVRAQDGRVEVVARPGSRLEESWRLETQDSPLHLAIPRDLKADVDVRTEDGRIHFELPVTIPGSRDPHSLRGRLNGGGPLLRLRSQDGSVTLTTSN
jgi:hypothetical protein